MRGALVGLMISIVVACAARQPSDNYDPRRVKMDQVIALWTQIRDWRREAGMKVDPSADAILELRGRPPKEARRVCPDTHPITKTCEDVCSLADAICDNAEAICDIANQLGKDDLQAQEKCRSATASCKEAKERCCSKCSEEPAK